jgi:hypothetical protein
MGKKLLAICHLVFKLHLLGFLALVQLPTEAQPLMPILFPTSIASFVAFPSLTTYTGVMAADVGSDWAYSFEVAHEQEQFGPAGDPWIQGERILMAHRFSKGLRDIAVGVLTDALYTYDVSAVSHPEIFISHRDAGQGAYGWIVAGTEELTFSASQWVPAFGPLEAGIWADRLIVQGIPVEILDAGMDLLKVVVTGMFPAIGLRSDWGGIRLGMGTGALTMSSITGDSASRYLPVMQWETTSAFRGAVLLVLGPFMVNAEFLSVEASGLARLSTTDSVVPFGIVEFPPATLETRSGQVAIGNHFMLHTHLHNFRSAGGKGTIDLRGMVPLFGFLLPKSYTVKDTNVFLEELGVGATGRLSLGRLDFAADLTVLSYTVRAELDTSYRVGIIFPMTIYDNINLVDMEKKAISLVGRATLQAGDSVILRAQVQGLLPFDPDWFKRQSTAEILDAASTTAKSWRSVRVTLALAIGTPGLKR